MAARLAIWRAEPITTWVSLGACFFGSLIFAASLFPREYDWRHNTISSLASPRANPHGYLIASAGLTITGLLLIPFAFFLQQRLESFAPKLTAWAGRLFLFGAACFCLSGIAVPGRYRILGIGRNHEHLAVISSIAFCLSVILYLGASRRWPPSLLMLRVAAGVVVILPGIGFALYQLCLFLTHEFSSPTVYDAIRVPFLTRTAFWEWVSAMCLYLFLGLMTLGAKTRREDR